MSLRKFSPLIRFSLIAGILLLAAIPITTAYADSFVVNTTDDNDDGQCDGNHCSLREAIIAANANPGPDTISFAGLDATGGDVTIQLLSALNPLTDNGTTIDGTTVVGYANAPVVNVVKGVGVIAEGLSIQGNNCVVRGLSMAGFFGTPGELGALEGGAIVVTGSGNLIEGNELGWGAFPNSRGVWLGGSGNTVIGNTISGNTYGIHLTYPNQVVQGNLIGTDASGTVPVPNTIGIVDEAASGGGHLIGGPGQGDGNVISGNTNYGILLTSASNTVQGNYIGTDITGSSALPNQESGLYVSSINALIGGPGQGEGNVISGNAHYGIEIVSDSNTVQGNYIGTDSSGSFAVPNQSVGLFITSDNNLIGGSGAGNLVSGNGWSGIFITTGDSANNLIQGNMVGTDSSGTNPIPNGGSGIWYIDGGGSTIGGWSPGLANVFAFNSYNGAAVEGPDQLVLGNTIFNNGTSGIFFNGNALISQNNIYDNGALGIKYLGGLNGTPAPVLSSGYSVINGTACSNCAVELFLVAPDPTGAGEGKEYLGSVAASGNGHFSFPLPSGFPFCGQVTATATDMDPRTSEFSQNVSGHCYQLGPYFLIPIWSFILIVCAVIGWRLHIRRPESRFIVPGSLVVGAALGAGLIGLATLLPAVQITLGGEPAVPYSGQAATCSDYLDPNGFSPLDGALLEFSDDILLSWTPTGNLPDGDLRWIVELVEVGEAGNLHTTQLNGASFSEIGLAPQAGSSYEWSLVGQHLIQDGQTWLTFCGTEAPWTFSIEEGEEEEESPPPEPTEEPTVEAACASPLITALMNMTCRLGPDPAYEELGYLLQGETAVPEGISMDTFWFWILNPDAQGHCFVASSGVQAECVEGLTVVSAPPLPTEPVCLPSLDRAACGDAGGTWTATTGTCNCP